MKFNEKAMWRTKIFMVFIDACWIGITGAVRTAGNMKQRLFGLVAAILQTAVDIVAVPVILAALFLIELAPVNEEDEFRAYYDMMNGIRDRVIEETNFRGV